MTRRFALSFAPALAAHALVLLGLSALASPAPIESSHPPLEVEVVVAPEPPETPAQPARPDPVLETEAPPPPAPVEPPNPRPRPRRGAQTMTKTSTVVDPRLEPAETAAPKVAPEVATASAETPSAPVPLTTPTPTPTPTPRGESVKARPRYRSNPRPDYPIESLRHCEEGTVLLDVDVTSDGRAAAVALRKTSGFAALDKAAEATVKGWTFEPARVDGVAIASQVVVPVKFSLGAP